MYFRAFLRHNTEIHRRWKLESRVGGDICGVAFEIEGLDYVSVDDPLSSDQVMALKGQHSIQLQLSTHPVDANIQVINSTSLSSSHKQKK
jgi:hypothetical protein